MPSTRDIEPAATLPPPIIGTDVPDSAPGIPQPVFDSGSATSPATPISITGSPIIPPPVIGDPVGYPTFPPTGTGTAPVAVPIGPEVGPAIAAAAVPPSLPGVVQPQYKTGSATSPTAASLFPSFSLAGPFQPIVLTTHMQIGAGPPPFTTGTQPIVISTAPNIPQLPWVPPGSTGLPAITTAPSITGTPPLHPGSVVTCSTGSWTNSPTAYHYQWGRNGSPIDGVPDTNTYTLVSADRGQAIACLVTAVNAAGAASAVAQPVMPTSGEARNPNLDPDLDPDLPSRSEHHGARAAHHGANKSKKKR